MERLIHDRLKVWKDSPNRKPLMLFGARQVGKTYALKEFGHREFDNLAYISCDRRDGLPELFEKGQDVQRLVLRLSSWAGQTITPGKTLLFLDEVQETPAAITCLKYFCEDMPELHVAVAGSLLGVKNMQKASFPVGKVDMMHMFPLTFDEFLLAMGRAPLYELLKEGDRDSLNALRAEYEELLRQYYFVGGMPEAVVSFVRDRNPIAVRRIQKSILNAYEADIAKHAGRDTLRVHMVWQSLPSQLGKENKKFIYGVIKQGARAREFESALHRLVDAGLLLRVPRIKCPMQPMRAYEDPAAFKLYLLDVGLLGAMSGTPAKNMLIGDGVFSTFYGSFTENYVLQQLLSLDDVPVYYYSKENSRLEIDFLTQIGEEILPLEVKAGVNVRSQSLKTFVDAYRGEGLGRGIRFSLLGFREQDWVENIPLFAVRDEMKRKVDASWPVLPSA
ncbi:MAG: ATP-binding protein [Akkermansia sp.]